MSISVHFIFSRAIHLVRRETPGWLVDQVALGPAAHLPEARRRQRDRLLAALPGGIPSADRVGRTPCRTDGRRAERAAGRIHPLHPARKPGDDCGERGHHGRKPALAGDRGAAGRGRLVRILVSGEASGLCRLVPLKTAGHQSAFV